MPSLSAPDTTGLPVPLISRVPGKRVLVLETRERIGGACTIEEPWPGVRMSPCAYLAGLLHPFVIEELNLPELGYSWSPATNGLFVPFRRRHEHSTL